MEPKETYRFNRYVTSSWTIICKLFFY